MKEEIIAKILDVPLEAWDKDTIMINGVSITFMEGSGGGQQMVWLSVDGLEINDPRLKSHYHKIIECRINNEEHTKQNKLRTIYSKIFKA